MTHSRVLIDASNLHVGGGVQVAASFLDELAVLRSNPDSCRQFPWLLELSVLASPAVINAMSNGGQLRVRSAHRRPWQVVWWLPRVRSADVSFVVFGPEYGWSRARRRIVGYADVTSIYAPPDGLPQETLPVRAKRLLRGFVSRLLLRRADRVVVETDEFADAVRRAVPTLRSPIAVVPNCVNQIILSAPAVALPHEAGARPRLLYVARAYPHKNHDFLGLVGADLTERGLEVEFAVTLTDDEWALRTREFRAHAVNLGELNLGELAQAYTRADAVVFPSLLESFSVTPLEAMLFGRLVFASDRNFVRTTCGDAVVYFDPLDPVNCADVIAEWLRDRHSLEETKAKLVAAVTAGMAGPKARALRYAQIIDEELQFA